MGWLTILTAPIWATEDTSSSIPLSVPTLPPCQKSWAMGLGTVLELTERLI